MTGPAALTPSSLVPLARAVVTGPAAREAALASLGSPSDEVVVRAALSGVVADDRNLRVAMLRVLSTYDGDEVVAAVLGATADAKRRVRHVAVSSTWRFLGRRDVLDRLAAVAADESEHPKVRGEALMRLAGRAPRPYIETPPSGLVADVAVEHLEQLMERDARVRGKVLFALLRSPLDDDVRRLLERFVRDGTKDEAVAATRALCGFRVRRVEEFRDASVARRVVLECERAGGRVWWWVPRAWDDAVL